MGEPEATFEGAAPTPPVWSMLEVLTAALEASARQDATSAAVVEDGLECLGEFATARQGSVYVSSPSRALRLAGKTGPRSLPEEVDPSEKTSVMLQALRGGNPLFIDDVEAFRTAIGIAPDYTRGPSDDRGCILLPLGPRDAYAEADGTGGTVRRDRGATGVLNLTGLAGGVPKPDSDAAYALTHGARLLGMALRANHAREELESRASLDSLTGLNNYASFYDSLGREVFRSERHGLPLSLILIDIDHFKSINDRYGHLAGDEILMELARRIRRALRGSDLPARYGGDEFAVTLPQTNCEGALRVASRIREQITSKAFTYLRTPIEVTASLGVAEFRDGMTAVDLVGKADRSLYTAKNEGRDRVIGAH